MAVKLSARLVSKEAIELLHWLDHSTDRFRAAGEWSALQLTGRYAASSDALTE
jgi:hypothetical protein